MFLRHFFFFELLINYFKCTYKNSKDYLLKLLLFRNYNDIILDKRNKYIKKSKNIYIVRNKQLD